MRDINISKLHKNHKTLKKNPKEVDLIVMRLLTRYNATQFTPLFRKAGWYLSEAQIVNFMEASTAARSPIAYFVTCVKNELRGTDA